MAKSIQDLTRIATDQIMNVMKPGGVSNRTEGELFKDILSIIQSVIASTGTIFYGVVTPSSQGPVASMTGNLAYISIQGTPGIYRYTNFSNLQVTITSDMTPVLILITRVSNVWSSTLIPLNVTNGMFRDVFFTVTATSGLTLRIQHGGMPDNAIMIIRRKKKNPSVSKLDKRRNLRKWSFLGPADIQENSNRDLGCYVIDIPRESGIYEIDLTPYLHFINRTTIGIPPNRILKEVYITGNKYTYGGLFELSSTNKIYQDLALQIAYRTGLQTRYLNERWRFGDMVRIRYVAQKVWAGDTKYDRISESITIK